MYRLRDVAKGIAAHTGHPMLLAEKVVRITEMLQEAPDERLGNIFF